jgi:hypothetical protein
MLGFAPGLNYSRSQIPTLRQLYFRGILGLFIPCLPPIRKRAEEIAYEATFLECYALVRRLLEMEIGMIPISKVVRVLFGVGIPAFRIDQWGSTFVDSFFDDALAYLQRAMASG